MASDRKHEREGRTAPEHDDETVEAPEGRDAERADAPNPPRTTAGGWTSPKFGSAGSGGAELEPGPERD